MKQNQNYFEFQAKGVSNPVFEIKNPDYSDKSLYLDNNVPKKIRNFNDGERIIVKVVNEMEMCGIRYFEIEDTEGNKASLSSKNFHKIIEPKNFSKKFQAFKQLHKILD